MTVTDLAEPVVTDEPDSTPISAARSLVPLAIDIAIPLTVYFGLRTVGVSLITALIASSVVPVLRTAGSIIRERSTNVLATLMLATNVAGIALSFVSGDVRVLFAKDAGISATIAVGILVSVVRRRPAMSAGLAPFVIKGERARAAAWDRLAAGSADFRRYERRYSTVWGVCLLADCTARVICAFTVPVATLSWLASVLLVGAIVVAVVVAGVIAVPQIERLVRAEAGE